MFIVQQQSIASRTRGAVGHRGFLRKGNQEPVSIATNALAHAKSNGHNVVIVDTAGRLAVDEEMMGDWQYS